MTREEELDWLCRLRSEIYVYMPKEWLMLWITSLRMARVINHIDMMVEPQERSGEE